MVYYLLDGGGASAELALGFQMVAFAAAALFSAVQVYRGARPLLAAHKPRLLPASWYKVSLAMTAALISFVVMTQCSVFLLEQLGSSDGAGFFNVASVLSMLVSLPLLMTNSPMLPALARLFANEQHREIRSLVTSSSRIAIVASVPVAIALVVGGELLIDALYGPRFAPAYPLLLVLIAGQFVNATAGSVGVILNMTGHERDVELTSVAVTALQIGASILVIPHHGTMGAAIVQAAALACWNLILIWRVAHRHGIDPTFIGAHAR